MKAAEDPLTGIRQRIDQIDARIHALLMERGGEIEALVRAKGGVEAGTAFRPGREAAIVRRLVLHHQGRLPLPMVEHVWRQILATFTAIQSPFAVAMAAGGTAAETASIRDMVRFQFGFSVPVTLCGDAAQAVARCAADALPTLAVVPHASRGAWWGVLDASAGPAVIARMPFVEGADHPLREAAYVIAPTSPDGEVYDRLVVRVAGAPVPGPVMRAAGAICVARQDDDCLVEIPEPVGIDGFAGAARAAGLDDLSLTAAGGIHAPIIVSADANNANDDSIQTGDGSREQQS